MMEWLSIFQTHREQSLQDILWQIVNVGGFWIGYTVVCALGAFFWLKITLRQLDKNLLTIGRMILISGLVLGLFVTFNSACQFLSAGLIATGSSFLSILLETDWCHRMGTPSQKLRAIIGDCVRGTGHRGVGD